jgi:hypothetical protein
MLTCDDLLRPQRLWTRAEVLVRPLQCPMLLVCTLGISANWRASFLQ